MPFIFVGYSHEDGKYAHRLADWPRWKSILPPCLHPGLMLSQQVPL
jgi:hypothetical protein